MLKLSGPGHSRNNMTHSLSAPQVPSGVVCQPYEDCEGYTFPALATQHSAVTKSYMGWGP